jgi:Trp operon repressor
MSTIIVNKLLTICKRSVTILLIVLSKRDRYYLLKRTKIVNKLLTNKPSQKIFIKRIVKHCAQQELNTQRTLQ